MRYILLLFTLLFTACNLENSGVDSNKANDFYNDLNQSNYSEINSSSGSEFNLTAIKVYFSQQKGIYSGGIDDKIIADINSSKSSIKLALYEFTNRKIKDALIDAYNRGVDVKIITDNKELSDSDKNLFDELEEEGIEVRSDEGFSNGLMHNKFLIIDNKILWSGSGNYTYYSFYRNYENYFRVLEKRVVNSYIDEFNELYQGELEKDNNRFKYYEVYFSYEDNFRANALLPLIKEANSSIYIAAFAMTDDELKDELIEAKKRGVDIHIILDKNQNDYQGEYSLYDDLKAASIDVKLIGDSVHKMHNKFIVIDKKIVQSGSYNYTVTANERNCENVLIIKNRDIALKYFNEFERIYNQ